MRGASYLIPHIVPDEFPTECGAPHGMWRTPQHFEAACLQHGATHDVMWYGTRGFSDRSTVRRPVLSCPVLSCPVLSCPVLSCPVLSCPLIRLEDKTIFTYVCLCVLCVRVMCEYSTLRVFRLSVLCIASRRRYFLCTPLQLYDTAPFLHNTPHWCWNSIHFNSISFDSK
jgi:hypothetical protein